MGVTLECPKSLLGSFEKLATVLAITEKDIKELGQLKTIGDLSEKENRMIQFVKKHLALQPNWLLIYDNVIRFEEIQKYFPRDSETWGSGKVIITTRDGNIGNNQHVDHVIFIEELTASEKLTLFTNIMTHDKPYLLTEPYMEEAKHFLKKIPSFPLDVSIAAYYLKATNVSYSTYLELIERLDKDFSYIQENVLREAGEYCMIRYRIITTSLNKILEEHKEFEELLLFIMLLNSQEIPRELLSDLKEDVLVSNFIFYLKKYSILTRKFAMTLASNTSISIHQSTQSIGLSYLLQRLGIEKKRELLSLIAKKIKKYYERNKKENHKMVSLIPHLESLLKNLRLFNIPLNLKDQYERNFLLMLASIHFHHTQNLVLAKKIYVQLVAHGIGKEEDSSSIGAMILKDLGSICILLGDFDEAIAYCQRSITILEKLKNSEMRLAENFQTVGISYNRKNNFKLSKYYFEKALKVISKLPVEEKQERQAEIYMRLSMLYESTYLGKYKADEMEKYAINSLVSLKNIRSVYESSQDHSGVSCESMEILAKSVSNLGAVYCILGKYKEAMEKLLEAKKLLSFSLKGKNSCSHAIVESFIALSISEILLREGDLESAHNELTLSIQTVTKLLGEYASIPWKFYRVEARIRLKKFIEAYEDCLDVFRLEREDDYTYRKIGNVTCLYHAAVIKNKQNDLEKSIEHFSDFFKKMKVFCKNFLEEKDYKELVSKNVFCDIDPRIPPSKERIKQYLARSTQVFVSIYGSDHLFVKDYVMENEREEG